MNTRHKTSIGISILWAAAILISAILGSSPFLSLILLPVLAVSAMPLIQAPNKKFP